MSLRNGQIHRENSDTRTAKATLQQTKSTCNARRLALGEVGNKINVNSTQNGAKPKEFKEPQQGVVKKITTKVVVKKTTSSEIVNNKKNEKQVVKPQLTLNKKYEDRALIKQIVKLPSLPNREESVSYSTKQLMGIIDVDTSENPLQVSEYVQDIYKYLLDVENQYSIEKNFLEGHKSTPRMRSVLINWMVEVHVNFKLLLETLHLSVAILDRYLQLNKQTGSESLQLVGIVALWIASKYEEIYLPDLSDFVYICDDTFSKKEILKTELDILAKLDFSMGRPLSLQFLRRFNKIAGVQADHHVLGKYLIELALIDYELCYIKPSLQAAAACCLARAILDGYVDPSQAWTKMLIHHTCYKYSDIKFVILTMACALTKAETSKYQATRTKYSNSNCSKISLNPKLTGPLVKKLVAQSTTIKKKEWFYL